MKKLFTLFTCALLATGMRTTAQQAELISPVTNNGGFENGPSNIAPWVIVNGSATNRYVVSNTGTPGFTGTYCTYVTSSTSAPYAPGYINTIASTVHAYQDVTFPAGKTDISLSYRCRQTGETSWDRLLIYISTGAPGAAPAAGTPASSSTAFTGYTLLYTTPMNAEWTTYNVAITAAQAGNAAIASNRRIIFCWQNDGSVGTSPGANFDDVTLLAKCPGGATPTVASAVTATTATLNWTALAGATGYQVRYKRVSDPVTVPTWATPTSVAGGTTTSVGITGLTGVTLYQYQVAAVGTTCTDFSFSSTFTTSCNATVPPYVETFESLPANNVMPLCMTATSLSTRVQTYTTPPGSYNRINHTPGGSKFGAFRYDANDWMFTRQLTLQGGKQYQFSFWYIADGLTGFTKLEAKYGTTNTAGGMTTTIGTPITGNIQNTTYQQFVGVFTPATTGDYFIGINGVGNGNPWYLSIDDINVLPMCAGTPVPGIISGPNLLCANTSMQLILSGYTTEGGITIQWQRSPAGTNVWTNIGGNDPILTTTLTQSSDYRAIVTCNSPGGGSSITAAYNVTEKPFYDCYCNTSTATYTGDEEIFGVAINQMNNTSNCASSNQMYTDYRPLGPLTDLRQGYVYPLSLTLGTCGGNYTRSAKVYIDYNHDAQFSDPAELAYVVDIANTVPNPTVNTGDVEIPSTALLGTTGMRVIYAETTSGNLSPCGSTSWGETEDYLVNIAYAPKPPTITAVKNPLCSGETLELNAATTLSNPIIVWHGPNSFITLGPKLIKGNIPVTDSGIYYVRAIVNGDSSGAAKINVKINPAPPAPVVINDTVCIGMPATIRVDQVPGWTYNWYTTPTGNTVGNTGGTYSSSSLTTNVTFYVQASAPSNPCLSDKAVASAAVGSKPVVDFGPDNTTCDNAPLVLEAYNYAGKYKWSTGDSTESISVNKTGTYWVEVDRYCLASDTININVDPLPTTNGIGYVRSGNTYTFSAANVQNATAYFWDFGDGSTSTLPSPTYTYNNGDIHIVSLLLYNACGVDTTIWYTPSSVKDAAALSESLKLYPNPAVSDITVEMDGNGTITDIVVLNNLGAVVYRSTEANKAKKQTINISNLANGHYMMRVNTADGVVNKPFDIVR